MPHHRIANPGAEFGERFGGEREVHGVRQVGVEFAREVRVEIVPDMTCPTPAEPPLGQRFIHDHRSVARC